MVKRGMATEQKWREPLDGMRFATLEPRFSNENISMPREITNERGDVSDYGKKQKEPLNLTGLTSKSSKEEVR
jgi:hypothetical protein